MRCCRLRLAMARARPPVNIMSAPIRMGAKVDPPVRTAGVAAAADDWVAPLTCAAAAVVGAAVVEIGRAHV